MVLNSVSNPVYGITQLSILVHPDKNTEDADRAQQAFEGKNC